MHQWLGHSILCGGLPKKLSKLGGHNVGGRGAMPLAIGAEQMVFGSVLVLHSYIGHSLYLVLQQSGNADLNLQYCLHWLPCLPCEDSKHLV